jgi:thymidylate kinase
MVVAGNIPSATCQLMAELGAATIPEIRVAIEGPCCAGKTTLAIGVSETYGTSSVTTVQDYADFLGGGGSRMPNEADGSVQGQRVALDYLLGVEKDRFEASAHAIASSRLLLIDRSCLTLVAHCAGLDACTRDGHKLERLAAATVAADPRSVVPSHIVYLDVSNDVQFARNRGKFSASSTFMDPGFNAGFRGYFADRMSSDFSAPLLWVDGEREPSAVLADAVAFLEDRSLVV